MNQQLKRHQLAAEIQQFLQIHAKMNANEPEQYASPDAATLKQFAQQLETESRLDARCLPCSSWESGGYKPYRDCNARRWHDQLLKQAHQYLESISIDSSIG